jgi:hypothetical protein
MVEKGVDDKFEMFVEEVWVDADRNPVWKTADSLLTWLITDPTRFCQLVYDSEVWRNE